MSRAHAHDSRQRFLRSSWCVRHRSERRLMSGLAAWRVHMACVLCHWDRHVTWLWQGKPAWTAFGRPLSFLIKGVAFYNVLVRVIRYSRVDPRPLRHTPAPPASVGHVKGRWLSRLHVQGHLSHAGAEILEDTSPEPVSSNENACRGHSNVPARLASHASARCEQLTDCCVHPLRRPAKNIHCATTMACVSIRRAS
jgi:hypothetical protein